MNALSDYLTKSGREESGVLLGAYEPTASNMIRTNNRAFVCQRVES